MAWKAYSDSDYLSMGHCPQSLRARVQLSPVASGLTLVRWEASFSSSSQHVLLIQSLLEQSYRVLFEALQEHWAARRAWEANLEKLVAFEQDAPDLGRSSPLPDRSHTFDDRLHIALSSRDSDCSSIASTLTGASCGSQGPPVQRCRSMWHQNSNALRAMLGSGNTSEDRLQQHGHGRMLMRPSASFGSDSACYTGLGTALEKSSSQEMSVESSSYDSEADAWYPQQSDFTKFAQQSFDAARSSNRHTRKSVERIRSTTLPLYLQLHH